jgi:hypothetical protein
MHRASASPTFDAPAACGDLAPRFSMRSAWMYRLAVYLWLAVSFFAASAIAFSANEYATFMQWDGIRHLVHAKEQYYWGGPFLANWLDFTKGIGDLTYPTLYRLDPSVALAYWFGGGEVIRWLAVALLSLEFFLAILVGGRTLGFTLLQSTLGACLACWIVQPYVVPVLGQLRLWGNPIFLTPLAVTTLATVLYWRLGRDQWSSTSRVLLGGIILGVCASALAVAQPGATVMVGPVSAALLLCAVACAESREERRQKLAVLAGVIIVASPFLAYVAELHLYTKTSFFYQEMYSTTLSWRNISFFTAPGDSRKLGPLFWIAAWAATIHAAVDARGVIRTFARSMLFSEALLIVLLGLLVLSGRPWGGPPLGYLEMPLFPFQALFLARGICAVAAKGRARIFRPAPDYSGTARWIVLILPWLGALPVALAGGTWINKRDTYWPWPPTVTSLVQFARDRVGLDGGGPFRGRVASITAEKKSKAFALDQFIYDYGFVALVGNDQRRTGFWSYRIPTLESSGQYGTPFFHAVATRLLGNESDISLRAHASFSRFDVRIMRAWGVRIVVEDEPLGPSLNVKNVGRHDLAGRTLYVYELGDPNVGNYSPTQPLLVRSVKEALEALARPALDLRNTFVTHETVSAQLVPAETTGLKIEEGGVLTLEAQSRGTSLLALPVEFSHCLSAANLHDGGTPLRLLRVNVNQTGVLFEKRLTLQLEQRFGPFTSQGCRLKDLRDAQALGMGEVSGWWPRK